MKPRIFQHQLHLPVPVDVVWNTIVDPTELVKWFPETASVQPGEGGSVTMGWGGMAETEPILHWDPPHRFATQFPGFGDMTPTVVEYVLETDGQGTRLTLVHSGFGEGDGWDRFFRGIESGWTYELYSMFWYLSRHHGQPCRMVAAFGEGHGSGTTVMDSLLAVLGWKRGAEGEPWEGKAPSGKTYSGRIRMAWPTMLVVEVESLDGALLRLAADESSDAANPCSIWMTLRLYGDAISAYDAEQGAWTRFLAGFGGDDPRRAHSGAADQ